MTPSQIRTHSIGGSDTAFPPGEACPVVWVTVIRVISVLSSRFPSRERSYNKYDEDLFPSGDVGGQKRVMATTVITFHQRPTSFFAPPHSIFPFVWGWLSAFEELLINTAAVANWMGRVVRILFLCKWPQKVTCYYITYILIKLWHLMQCLFCSTSDFSSLFASSVWIRLGPFDSTCTYVYVISVGSFWFLTFWFTCDVLNTTTRRCGHSKVCTLWGINA